MFGGKADMASCTAMAAYDPMDGAHSAASKCPRVCILDCNPDMLFDYAVALELGLSCDKICTPTSGGCRSTTKFGWNIRSGRGAFLRNAQPRGARCMGFYEPYEWCRRNIPSLCE